MLQLTNTDPYDPTTLEALQDLVTSGREVSIYRDARPEIPAVLALQQARLTSASGPYQADRYLHVQWAVSYQASNGDSSFLALPDHWTWRITMTDPEEV